MQSSLEVSNTSATNGSPNSSKESSLRPLTPDQESTPINSTKENGKKHVLFHNQISKKIHFLAKKLRQINLRIHIIFLLAKKKEIRFFNDDVISRNVRLLLNHKKIFREINTHCKTTTCTVWKSRRKRYHAKFFFVKSHIKNL